MSAPREGWGNFIAHVIIALLSFVLIFMIVTTGPQLLDRVRELAPTSTPRVTAAPTATARPGDTIAWVSYHAGNGCADDVSFRAAYENSSDGESILVIKFFMSPMSSGKSYRRSAAQTIIDVGYAIRKRGYHKKYDSVNFLFYGGFIDKYGNREENLGIRAWYTSEEIGLLNFEYFEDSVYSNPDAIIKAADDYIIHPAYQK